MVETSVIYFIVVDGSWYFVFRKSSENVGSGSNESHAVLVGV